MWPSKSPNTGSTSFSSANNRISFVSDKEEGAKIKPRKFGTVRQPMVKKTASLPQSLRLTLESKPDAHALFLNLQRHGWGQLTTWTQQLLSNTSDISQEEALLLVARVVDNMLTTAFKDAHNNSPAKAATSKATGHRLSCFTDALDSTPTEVRKPF